MPRYVAFLRAINVGGHTVKMDRLRALFEAMGFDGVSTFIASGNVIFDSPSEDAAALEGRIERHLQAELGYAVGTFLRTAQEVARAAAAKPFGDATDEAGRTLMVTFLKTPLEAGAVRRLKELESENDRFQADGLELWWLTGARMTDSPAAAPMAKIMGASGTMRNVTTVRKLAAKHPPEA